MLVRSKASILDREGVVRRKQLLFKRRPHVTAIDLFSSTEDHRDHPLEIHPVMSTRGLVEIWLLLRNKRVRDLLVAVYWTQKRNRWAPKDDKT